MASPEPRIVIRKYIDEEPIEVPILAQGFSWSLIPGVNPYMTSIVVSDLEASILRNMENPVEISLTITGGTSLPLEEDELIIENVYLLEPKPAGYRNEVWHLADSRWGLRGKKLYFIYNKTRDKNEFNSVLVGSPSNDPAVLRQDIDLFKVGRYIPHTIKGGETPYTMKEILEIELLKLGYTISYIGDEDKSYILENVDMQGADVYQGIEYLLSASRLNMGILLDGSLTVYPIDFWDTGDIVGDIELLPHTAPTKIYTQELDRIRPEKIFIKFEKKQETRIIATTSEGMTGSPGFVPIPVPTSNVVTSADVELRRAIGCENVISNPYPIMIGGRLIHVGEYVRMWEYLQAIGLTEAEVQQYWFGSQLEIYFTTKIAAIAPPDLDELGKDAIANAIIASIRSHYRQVYQIDPYYMDRIEKWECRRVGVIDNYSRYTPVSPLWSDFCIVPSQRIPALARRKKLHSSYYYNWIVNTRDPNRERPTAGTIVPVNTNLGIFRVSFPSLIDRVIQEIIPSAIDPLPGIGVGGTILQQCHLASTHTLETLVSLVWMVDIADLQAERYYEVELDYFYLGGTGPNIEYLSRLDYARFGTRQTDESVPDPTIPQNLGIVEALAKAEGAKLINRYLDRPSGIVTLAGFHAFMLEGNMKSITYSFSPNRGFETIVDIREVPPDPRLEQVTEQKVIDYVRRHVTKGSEQNTIGELK